MTSKTRTRWTSLGIIVGTLLLIASIASAFWVQQGRIDVGAARYDNLSAKYDRLFAQYSRLYGDCAESTNCEPTAPAPEAIPGVAVKNGERGADGRDATDSQVAAAVRDYCDARLGCAGTPGVSGTPGTPGTPGRDGINGTDGAPGQQGVAGPVGPIGPDGRDGQPPLSWTYTDPLGITYSCTRTDPFDPTAPTYSCAPTPIGDPQ